MSRVLAIAIWLTAIVTVGLFAWLKWRLPESVSAHSAALARHFKITLIVIGFWFALTHASLGYAVCRYRAKNGERASNSSGNARVEIILAAITAVVFIALAITGQRVWAGLRLNQPPPTSLVDAV